MNITVLITGASRGIGKQIAIIFAQNGFNIVATCHNNIDTLSSLKNELSKYNVNIFLFQGWSIVSFGKRHRIPGRHAIAIS